MLLPRKKLLCLFLMAHFQASYTHDMLNATMQTILFAKRTILSKTSHLFKG